jgi:uncharacterized damage-inducible protein DinB
MEISTVASFLDYFDKVRSRTMRIVRCIPPDKLEWRPAEGKFTLGDLARHIAATERYVFAESAGGGRNRYPGCGTDLADGYDNVLAFIDRMHAESLDIFSRLTDADLQKKCLSADGHSMATWKWLRAMVEHEIHHRGELYAYVGLLGVAVPPLYGRTSEELKEIARAAE